MKGYRSIALRRAIKNNEAIFESMYDCEEGGPR